MNPRLVVLLSFGVTACGGGGDRPPAAAAAPDTAAPALPATAAWRVDSVPQLQIGRADGGAEYQFVRIVGAALLSRGRIAVADGGASEIRVYDAAGGFVRADGRPGDGPGEYRQISALGVGPGDTIWVYDFGLRRFTFLNTGLMVVRSVTLSGDLGNVGAVAPLSDGSFLVREYWSSRPAADLGLGLRRDSAAIARVDRAGNLRDTVALVPGREVVISSEGGRPVMSAPLGARMASVAWLRPTGEIVVGDQAGYELKVLGPAGDLRRTLRWAGADLRLDDSLVARALDARLAEVPAAQRPARRIELEALPRPPARPAHGEILTDPFGGIWVAAWDPSGAPRSWTVLDRNGRLIGVVGMPSGFEPLWIGDDAVVGVHRDGDGVETVRVHPILRGQ